MKPSALLSACAAFACAAPLWGASTDDVLPPDQNQTGRWAFHFAPKSFQANPSVDMAIITEMTPAGRAMPKATSAKPIYYVPQMGGYHDEGDQAGREHLIPLDKLQAELVASLKESHFQATDASHPPTIVIVFHAGAATKLDGDKADIAEDPNATGGHEDIAHQNLLARAALVGGQAFAHELEKALLVRDNEKGVGRKISMMDPVEKLKNRSDKYRALIDETFDDVYYVVASAYDGGSIAKGKPVLLWRTKMTTNSNGLAMAQALPTLIVTSGPFFGKDMSEASTQTRHLVPEGQINIGTPVEVAGTPAATKP